MGMENSCMNDNTQITKKYQTQKNGIYSGDHSMKEKNKKRCVRVYYVFACFAILLSLVWIIFIVFGAELLRLTISDSCGSGEGSACGWAIVGLGIPFLFLIVFYSGILTILQKTMKQLLKNGGVQKKIQILHRIIFGYAILLALFYTVLIVIFVIHVF